MHGVPYQNTWVLVRTLVAAAAVCRVCKFVAVEASVDSSRFNVVSWVAVLASEGYAASASKATIVGPWSTFSKRLRSTSIWGGSASSFLSIPLLSWISLAIPVGNIGLFWLVVSYVGALDD